MRYKAYRYRLYPNKEQQELINKHIGCCRYIYNYGLEKKIKAYQECKKAISRFDIQRELPMLKKNEETSFLKEVNSLSLQAALACLDNAFTRFFIFFIISSFPRLSRLPLFYIFLFIIFYHNIYLVNNILLG